MKRSTKIGITFFLLAVGLGIGTKTYLKYMSEAIWVKHYRSTQSPKTEQYPFLNLTGLQDLRISGSNRPIFSDIKNKLNQVKGKIYIVDLTGGAQPYLHGKYPLDFLGFSAKKPNKPELRIRRFLVNGWSDFDPSKFVSEEVVAKQHGFEYRKFFNDRGITPSAQVVDDLIKLIESVEPDDWIHFHCLGGNSRTTMAMALVDILKNGKKIPLEDIIQRQFLMGGINLFDTTVWQKGSSYTAERLNARKKLMENLYIYVNDPEGYGKQRWSEWCILHHIEDFKETERKA
jgi:hypothetical protein